MASYVAKAANEDLKAKLIMEINDLKQLLGGRKAQVDSLSAEKVRLEQSVNRLQERVLERKCSICAQGVSCSIPLPIPATNRNEEQYEIDVKVVEEMQLDALKLEAAARGMDAATVIPMTKDTLLKELVIGTTCISKSAIWSKVVSLRNRIENEKVAIHARQNEKQQPQQNIPETNCSSTRKKYLRRKVAVAQHKDQHGHGHLHLSKSRNTNTLTNAGTKTKTKRSVTRSPTSKANKNKKTDNGISVPENNTTATLIDISSVSYPSLADKDDEKYCFPSHAIIRRDILETFVTVAPKLKLKLKKDARKIPIRSMSMRKLTRQQRYAGFIGFRCCYCKDKPINKRADLAAIFPESISGIYRAIIRFQSKHIQTCHYIPKQLKEQMNRLKTNNKNKSSTRGKKNYWTQSALKKGFCDWQSPTGRKGIIYCPKPEELF